MSHLEVDKLEEPEFKWLKEKEGGKRYRDIHFYESFVYEGVEYSLYDSVYLQVENEQHPYIGKLVLIWEEADKSKKIRVQWFFRPLEILYYLGDTEVIENELLLASGCGIGLTNISPLEKRTWLKLGNMSWESTKTAQNEGKLVLLQNLDPTLTSAEVKDIIWHAFEEKCLAKMVQHTAMSSSHNGQALLIFDTREVAERVFKELDDKCLMLLDQRPLVGRTVLLPEDPMKQTTFVGHLSIHKVRRLMQREMKEAVSTSHYSQPNTIEYEMAMEWSLLQSKSNIWFQKLFQQHKLESRKLVANLQVK